VLPFHVGSMNAAYQLREIERRWPCHGADRRQLPLFPQPDGTPFTADRFDRFVRGLIAAAVGTAAAELYSCASWRVFVATGLRMLDAPKRVSMTFGRWLNPASLRIYARMTTTEYTSWVDRLLSVRHIDAARTTNLGLFDESSFMQGWEEGFRQREEQGADALALPAVGARLHVLWIDSPAGSGLDEWYVGTVTSYRGSDAHVAYDAVGPWKKASDLSYWHDLSTETWELDGA
jgi:hypothetical protein